MAPTEAQREALGAVHPVQARPGQTREQAINFQIAQMHYWLSLAGVGEASDEDLRELIESVSPPAMAGEGEASGEDFRELAESVDVEKDGFTCPECGKTLKTAGGRDAHRAAKHPPPQVREALRREAAANAATAEAERASWAERRRREEERVARRARFVRGTIAAWCLGGLALMFLAASAIVPAVILIPYVVVGFLAVERFG